MRRLTYLVAIAFFSVGAAANNVNERVACEGLAVQALKDPDWKTYEEDFVRTNVVEAKLLNNRLSYVIRAGKKVAQADPANSS